MHNLNAVNFSKGTNVGNLSLPSARCLHRSHYALRSLVCARSWHMKTKQDRDTSSVTRTLSPVQTDGTLLANNSQRCWMLHVALVCKQCWMLLYVAACCWELLRKVWNRSNSWANNCPSQYFFCSMIADVGSMLDQCWIHFHTSSNIVVLGHACALHNDTPLFETIPRCTAGPNTAGSYCIRLHTTAARNATTPNIAGPTMLEVVLSVCK